MTDWNWCTILLLLLVSIIVLVVLVGGTCATMTYFRMVERYHHDQHPANKMYNYVPNAPEPLAASQFNPQQKQCQSPQPALPYSQPALPYSQHYDPNNPHMSPYIPPTVANANNLYNQMTPEQQQALVQYWQMMYYQYMQQIMAAAKDEQYER